MHTRRAVKNIQEKYQENYNPKFKTMKLVVTLYYITHHRGPKLTLKSVFIMCKMENESQAML